MSDLEQEKEGLLQNGQPVSGFHTLLGYHIVERDENRTVIELEIRPEHINLGGVIHGGILMSLLDVACAMSGTYCPEPGRVRKAISLSLTTTFTGQCSGGTIRAIGLKRAGGSRIYNSTGEIYDQDGNLLALGEGTFRLRTGSESSAGVPVDAC